MKTKSALAALIGMAALMEGVNMPIANARTLTPSVTNGHTSRGRSHNKKVKKWREKERRAKQARKINWN